jgi:hypothetical protein
MNVRKWQMLRMQGITRWMWMLILAVGIPLTVKSDETSVKIDHKTGSVGNGSQIATEDASLVGWWKLDEKSGTTVHDSSGNGKHGRLVEGPTWTPGKINGALHFSSTFLTNEHVSIPNADAVRAAVHSGQYSISCWAYPERVPDQDPRNTGEGLVFTDYRGLSWNMSQRFFMGYYAGSGDNRWAKSSVHSPGKWYHVAGTVDSSQGTTKIYVNGKHEGTASFTAGNKDTGTGNTLLFGIGNPNYPSGQYGNFREAYKGKIDDVRIYNRTLSDAEIAMLASQGEPKF